MVKVCPLYRSVDGRNFESIAVVAGHGNTNHIVDYSYTDEKPFPGVSYYRLKQTDFNGESELFRILSVNMNNEHNQIISSVYPNR